MTLEELKKIVRNLADIKEIEQLQRIYGYYLEHWMAEEIVDLFSDGPNVGLEWPYGKHFGKKGVKWFFEEYERNVDTPEFLHHLMQVSPVITVAPDGETAKGRWYSFGGIALPCGEGIDAFFCSGIYENDYVKEDGKWKIERIRWQNVYRAAPGEGWVAPERIAARDARDPDSRENEPTPDVADTRKALKYPSGYIFPFHFKHPITGKKTTEEKRNARRGIKK